MAFSRLTTNTVTNGSGQFLIGDQGAVIASADSITITSGFHEITGSTTVNTILGGTANTALVLYRPTGATWALGSAGNIEAGAATLAERVVLLVTPDGNTWYGAADSTSVASANTDISVAESGGVYTLTFNPANVSLDEFAGPVGIAKGGTGQTTATAAFDALAPTTTQGDLIQHNGTDNVRLPKGTAYQVPQMNAGATAVEWTTQVNVAAMPTLPSCALTKSATQAIATGTPTAVTFDTETHDTLAMHEGVTNPSRITVPAGHAGTYLITGTVSFAANATGYRAAAIYWDGAQVAISYAMNTGAGDIASATVTALAGTAAVGAYFQLYASQTSGGDLAVQNNSLTTFTAARIA